MATSPQYDFIKYRAQVNTVTEQFTALSRQVIDIIKLLRDNNAEAVAVLLEKLQATEKEKLEMVCPLLYTEYICCRVTQFQGVSNEAKCLMKFEFGPLQVVVWFLVHCPHQITTIASFHHYWHHACAVMPFAILHVFN